GSLQDYSYLKEKNVAPHPFEHRGYLEFSMGLSFAKEEFASKVPVSNYPGMEMVGFSSKMTMGYWFTRGIGVSFASRTSQYDVVGHSSRLMYWDLDAFTLGPVISVPLARKLRFDLTPSIGFATAYLTVDDEEVYTGEGLGMNITGALVYHMSKRLFVSASAGYLSSRQEYNDGGSGNARDMDVELGLGYKFGKRSL
ncbi:MAG TPA: hypothetical protein VGK10_06715, partial [Prolixibacteraceae bacterium]